MNSKIRLVLLLIASVVLGSCEAKIPPLVYDQENMGQNLSQGVLPEFDQLSVVENLTDPFAWSDGSGRSTDFKDWSRRRNEIGAEIQHYEIGPKPSRPDSISASFVNDTLRVAITANGNTLTLISAVLLPEGDGPFPAVIGVGRSSGSLPPDIFASKNIAQITFNFGDVLAWKQVRGNEPINKLYPDLEYMGAYAAWSWG
nr:hypothetical protein [Draconibacterium halophilum]